MEGGKAKRRNANMREWVAIKGHKNNRLSGLKLHLDEKKAHPEQHFQNAVDKGSKTMIRNQL